jgi:biopolymer transport protein ExbB/TolQ
MSIIQQGSVMMWPLILLSVPALGVIMERFVFLFPTHFLFQKNSRSLTM